MDSIAAPPCVLVTGASSGLGRVTAHLLAAEGFRVFGTSRREMEGETFETLPLDVRSAESVERCVSEVLNRAGRLDVLVNNAGILHVGIAEETSLEEARGVLETNFFGPVRLTRVVLPHMRARGSGQIINVGSLAGRLGEPGEAFYAASKAALARYTEALRHEVRSLGIHVSLVEPGAFRTGILSEASVSEATHPDYAALHASVVDTLSRSVRRGSEPADVARLILGIVRSRAPKGRYAAGFEGRWLPWLRLLLPQRVLDHLLRRGYGLSD